MANLRNIPNILTVSRIFAVLIFVAMASVAHLEAMGDKSYVCTMRIVAVVLALLAGWGQMGSTYSQDKLILVGKTVEIRSLPVENSGSVLKKIAPGGNAVLIEKRGSWLRIICDGVEGWIPEAQAVQVFPYGIL